MKKVFIICSVRGASEEYQTKLQKYVDELEANNTEVHLPHRDTKFIKQEIGGLTEDLPTF